VFPVVIVVVFKGGERKTLPAVHGNAGHAAQVSFMRKDSIGTKPN